MRDPVMEAFDRVSAARERDHECECDCAGKLRDLAQELAAGLKRAHAELLHASGNGGKLRTTLQGFEQTGFHEDCIEQLSRARAAGLLP